MSVLEKLAASTITLIFLTPMPHKWELFDHDLSLTTRVILNMGSYFIALVLFSTAGLKFLGDYANVRGYINGTRRRAMVILGSIFILTQMMWAACLYLNYIAFCSFYPWPTIVVVLAIFYITCLQKSSEFAIGFGRSSPSVYQTVASLFDPKKFDIGRNRYMPGSTSGLTGGQGKFGHQYGLIDNRPAPFVNVLPVRHSLPPIQDEHSKDLFQGLTHYSENSVDNAPGGQKKQKQQARTKTLKSPPQYRAASGEGSSSTICVQRGNVTNSKCIVREGRVTRSGLVYAQESKLLFLPKK